MLFESNCTVFNIVYDSETRLDKLSAVHIYGVHWENSKAANVIKSGMADADGVEIYIPFSATCDKTYKKPKEFKKSSEGSFTFTPGDIIVKGVVEYNGSIAKLTEVFDDTAVITSVDTFDYGSPSMQHWEISGK